MSTETEDAEIFYTLDGTEPIAESTKYAESIVVSEDVTVKAIAIKEGMINSAVLEELLILSKNKLAKMAAEKRL